MALIITLYSSESSDTGISFMELHYLHHGYHDDQEIHGIFTQSLIKKLPWRYTICLWKTKFSRMWNKAVKIFIAKAVNLCKYLPKKDQTIIWFIAEIDICLLENTAVIRSQISYSMAIKKFILSDTACYFCSLQLKWSNCNCRLTIHLKFS